MTFRLGQNISPSFMRFSFLIGGYLKSLVLVVCSIMAVACLVQKAQAKMPECTQFQDGFALLSKDLSLGFTRSLVVRRAGNAAHTEQYDMTGDKDIFGTLVCKGEEFKRFELRLNIPAEQNILNRYGRLQEIALRVGLKLDAGQASSKLRDMVNDAADYLRASIERGDVYFSGKTEEHFGENGDVGLIWTDKDRSLIITEPDF